MIHYYQLIKSLKTVLSTRSLNQFSESPAWKKFNKFY